MGCNYQKEVEGNGGRQKCDVFFQHARMPAAYKFLRDIREN